MRRAHVIACLFGLAAAAMAGCGDSQLAPFGAAPRSAAYGSSHLSPLIERLLAMTQVDPRTTPRRAVYLKSWMNNVPAGAPLLYVSDNGYYPAVVDVFNYSNGSLVGQVAGSFEYLYNPCSDRAGNVYVPDFKSGIVYEIQHRTTAVINSWPSNGNPIGCSVSKSGDLAVTAFHYGSVSSDGAVIVYAGAGKKGTVHAGPGDDFPATYDEAGNLFLEADYAGACANPCLAELPKGSGHWKVLSYDQTIYFPGSVELMGKMLGVGDQESDGLPETAIYATTISGGSATNARTTTLTDSKCGKGNELIGWANVSKEPNGLQTKKISGIAAANVLCETLDKWKLPAGGSQSGVINGAASPHGATLTK